jgi:hypothetical protein
MKQSHWQRALVFIVTASFTLTSCTSLQGVTLPSAERPSQLPAVKPGETVVLTTRSGQTQSFEVTAVEADALVGKNIRVPYADIATLNVRRFNSARTGIVAIVVGAIALIAVLVAVIEDEGGFGIPSTAP